MVIQASAPSSKARNEADSLYKMLSMQPDIHSDMITKKLIPFSHPGHPHSDPNMMDASVRILQRLDNSIVSFTDAVYDELKEAEEREKTAPKKVAVKGKKEKKGKTEKHVERTEEISEEAEEKEIEEIIKDDTMLISTLKRANGGKLINSRNGVPRKAQVVKRGSSREHIGHKHKEFVNQEADD